MKNRLGLKIFVGGINGTGKSTILKKTAELLDYEYIHSAGRLMKYLNLGNDYDKLRALDTNVKNKKIKLFINELIVGSKNKSFLLDSHYLNLVYGKVTKITDQWLGSFDALVLISSPLEDVWDRITLDLSKRDRALFPLNMSAEDKKKMLKKYQIETKKEFLSLTKKYNIPSIEIVNKKQKIDVAIDELVTFIQQIK